MTENNLYNNVTDVNVTAYRVAEGGVMLDKIPAQFLRTLHSDPQVSRPQISTFFQVRKVIFSPKNPI